MQMWSVINMFLILCVWSFKKMNYDFFLLNFISRFIDVHRLDTVFSLILLISKTL